jgi:adenylate cyclase
MHSAPSDILADTTPNPANSRLSAIVLVDAAGSSAAMNQNEVATFRSIERALDAFGAEVSAADGRVLNYTGDGALAVFASAVNAVRAAIGFQEALRSLSGSGEAEIGFRAGVHLGEVFENRGRAFGDSLNLVERIQSASTVGGVCVSDFVYRAIRGRPEFSFEYVGPHHVKNMPEPVDLYRIHRGAAALLKASPRPLSSRRDQEGVIWRRAEGEIPSIAVLPFRNVSGDLDQDYFVDGVTDDIITSLSRFRGLDLIARGSSFAFRDKDLPVSQVGARLGARYVAEGSIRRSGNRVRVSIELSNTENEHTIWAERYDRPLEDIFALQDEIAELAVSAMSVQIEDAERKRLTSTPPDSLHAYGLALKGHNHLLNLTAGDNALAREYYERSILASPRYGRAYAGMSRANSLDWRYSWSPDFDKSLGRAFDIAVQAISADPNDARGHAELGFALLYLKEHDRSLASYRRALIFNPNDATIIAEMADALTHSGFSEEALMHFERAIRLNPFYPDQYLWDMAGAYMKLHRFQEAIDSVQRMHNVSQGRRILACCHAHLGHMAEARCEAEFVRAAQPDFDAERWVEIVPDRRPEDKQTLLEGLKAAGL